jgi:hypothetical protein
MRKIVELFEQILRDRTVGAVFDDKSATSVKTVQLTQPFFFFEMTHRKECRDLVSSRSISIWPPSKYDMVQQEGVTC